MATPSIARHIREPLLEALIAEYGGTREEWLAMRSLTRVCDVVEKAVLELQEPVTIDNARYATDEDGDIWVGGRDGRWHFAWWHDGRPVDHLNQWTAGGVRRDVAAYHDWALSR